MIVRAPASSANLGPGFDCFGIAWQLYNEIEFLPSDSLRITGCDEKYRNADNLAYRAYAFTLEKCGIAPDTVEIRFRKTEVPVSRGLGSSSALIAAGVLAADRLHSLALDADRLLELATEIEGHPDNVAPALRGGFTASSMVGRRPVTVHFPLSDRLVFAALVPPTELSTALARSVLPKSVPHGDAVFNVSRAALVLSALGSGDTELLGAAMADKLHQPYRLPLIADGDRAIELAFSCGAKALCISGAGSTLLAISDEETMPGKLSSVIELLPDWRVIALRPDTEGARIS